MGIIDRYLLRKFVHTFVICFLSLFGLFVLVELSTNLEKFIEAGRIAGSVVPFIADYYSYQSILFFENTCGFLNLVAAMFTVAWIQRHNEMTALMSAGVSRIRVLMPIIAAVAVVSLLSMANRELLIPRYRAELSRRPQDPGGYKPQGVERRYDGLTDVVLSGKHTYADRRRIEEPDFRLPRSLQEYGPQLSAENAFYQPARGQRPSGYLLDGMREPKNLDSRPSLLLNGRPVVITPHDAPEWLKANQCFLVSDVAFDQLTAGGNSKQLSSTLQLIRGLHNPSLNYQSDVRVEIHSRLVRPLLDLTLLFLGLPLVTGRETRNVFLAMGLCILLVVAFWIVVLGAQYLGTISFWIFTPALAAWLPLMIFVPLAVALSENLWR